MCIQIIVQFDAFLGFVNSQRLVGALYDSLPRPRDTLAAEDAPGGGTERAEDVRVLRARG